MTEASDRIYQEVGDDAEIIWGQTFDEELGDEIRITVIATGIGTDEPEESNNIHHFDPAIVQNTDYQQPAAIPQAVNQSLPEQQPIARGHLRTPTKEELSNWNEFDNPVMVQQKKAVGDEGLAGGYSAIAFDNDDLEVPTFLRRKAD
jgi:cell division protein FtsZ